MLRIAGSANVIAETMISSTASATYTTDTPHRWVASPVSSIAAGGNT